MNQKTTNSNSQNIPHPEDFYKDEWVLSRESIYAGGIIVDHHLEPPDSIESGATDYHLMGYLLNNFSAYQITLIDDKKYEGSNEYSDFWLKPSQASGFWSWKDTDECLIFAIKPAFLKKVALENNCLNPDKIELLPVVKNSDPQIDIVVAQFRQEMNNAEFGNRMYIESLANVFAIQILRNYCVFPATLKKYQGGLAPHKLRQATDYINDNLDRPIKLKEIAELLNLSQFYFSHMFKQSFGVAPYRYVIQQRIEKAKKLIKHSKLPLTNIAYECGFSSQSQMTQHFRQIVGITPRAYRMRIK